MFVDNAVVKKFDGEDRYDRFAIAGTLFYVSFKGASCSVIESRMLKKLRGLQFEVFIQED